MKISFTSILACSALFGGVFAAPTSLPEASIEERQISSQLLGVVQNLFTNVQTITTQIGTSLKQKQQFEQTQLTGFGTETTASTLTKTATAAQKLAAAKAANAQIQSIVTTLKASNTAIKKLQATNLTPAQAAQLGTTVESLVADLNSAIAEIKTALGSCMF